MITAPPFLVLGRISLRFSAFKLVSGMHEPWSQFFQDLEDQYLLLLLFVCLLIEIVDLLGGIHDLFVNFVYSMTASRWADIPGSSNPCTSRSCSCFSSACSSSHAEWCIDSASARSGS